ncbi:glycosyltransferase [Paracoccus sp. DMF-8]|uniref:glycosyltransferase n=1 Tax=Paracoccus sp. DMF-8 TaxID=3019445 RepID=UPI0023E78751|nr:glycosyltransferase [Paracoccus sp. DMF-8]MDF3606137.1 glycosyltransferase [Paracoccus sp. DMF-8]
MTKIISIFERLGAGGGGKIKAVYHRLNAFSEMPDFEPILLNLSHATAQKENFLKLQADGTIFPKVKYLTLPEACAATDASNSLPLFDIAAEIGQANASVRMKNTGIGRVLKYTIHEKDVRRIYTMINDEIFQLSVKKPDGISETTDYAQNRAIRWTRTKGDKFLVGRNLINGKSYGMNRAFIRSFYEIVPWGPAITFFDGITSAYLSAATKSPRVLFLHADHMNYAGKTLHRAKLLIEGFAGEAIITATNAHKKQIASDLKPSAEVHVLPHFCEIEPGAKLPRKDLVTVSRLDLEGKPINECIDAFDLIKEEFPEVNYLIYGEGAGRDQLIKQIDKLGLADRVKLMGYTTAPLDVFRGATASVYPTMTEGFGLSILEALSCGCPVVSYDVNYGPRELIKPGKNGDLVSPGDIDAIAASLRRILKNPKRFQRNTGYQLERYTRDSYVNNYRAIADKLTAST